MNILRQPGETAREADLYGSEPVRVKNENQVQIYIYLNDSSAEIIDILRNIDLEIEVINTELRIVQGWLAVERIDELSQLYFIDEISAPSYAHQDVGSVTSEGDAILRANLLRDFGVDGRGVKVGIISNGANNWPQARASGDLPQSGIRVYGSCTKEPADPANCKPDRDCNEGAAVAEIAHDIAPGAAIAVGAAGTTLEFIARLNDLANSFGADIVVDDLTWFNQPYFEDGLLAQAVSDIKNRVVYVASAGNYASRHYEAEFWEYDPPIEGFDLHDFGAVEGESSNWAFEFYVEPEKRLSVFLQWNDNFGQSANDYDLKVDLLNADTGAYIETLKSEDVQNGTQDPYEAVGICNRQSYPFTAKFYVDRYSGNSRRLEMLVSGPSPVRYNRPAGSVIGHSAVSGILAVGAISASDPSNDNIESFSSHGPSYIYYPSFESRSKPDLVAIDGVSVTGTGGFSSTFYGASASAPHVAGIAALLKQAMPDATPAEIRTVLLDSSVDLGDSGYDFIFGEGRADSLLAETLLNTDRDALLNGSDSDDDADGTFDVVDNCRLVPNADQADSDEDTIGDVCDELPIEEGLCFPIKTQMGKLALICL